MKELFPDAQVTIGPVIDNGFYYDFSYKRPFTPEDLRAIEDKMVELAKRDEKVERRVLPRDEAVAYFKSHRRALQGGDHREHPGRRGGVAVSRGQVRGPVPRAARAVDGQAEALQADEGGRRLLARRPPQRTSCSASTARRGRRRRSCSSTCIGSRRPRSATTASSAESSICSTSRTMRRAWCSGIPKGWTVWQQVEQYMRRVYRDNGYLEVKGPQMLDRSCGKRRGTGRTSARTCSRRRARSATTR